jgi:hypothetical protein
VISATRLTTEHVNGFETRGVKKRVDDDDFLAGWKLSDSPSKLLPEIRAICAADRTTTSAAIAGADMVHLERRFRELP